MKRGEAILACIFLGIFLVVVIAATGYNRKARQMPLVVGVPGLVLSAGEVARQVFRKREPRLKETAARGSDEYKKTLRAIGWMVLLVALIWILGFTIGLPLFSMLFMKARKESWVTSVIITLIGVSVIYFLFGMGLEMSLYKGLLFQD
jgi:hypothetical protein